jgi:DNA adenine methylase
MERPSFFLGVTMPATNDARPFLKWAGGKRQLLAEIKKHIPGKFGRYYEPFVGGGALFFDLQPSKSTLSDSNVRLMRTYRAVRDDVERVIRLLEKCPYEKEFYDDALKIDVDKLTDAQLAAWFIFVNKVGFNGLYRVNKANKFNVPFGTYKNPRICDAPNLRACSTALQGVQLVDGDFADVLKKTKKGDFVYIDPPYIPASDTASFTAYQAGGFTMDDQTRLQAVAWQLAHKGVHVLLSASMTEGTLSLYDSPSFELIEVAAKRSINSDAEKRGDVSELLILCKQGR